MAAFDDLNGPFLVPGIGAQGGTADDVRRLFGAGPGVVALRAAVDALDRGSSRSWR